MKKFVWAVAVIAVGLLCSAVAYSQRPSTRAYESGTGSTFGTLAATTATASSGELSLTGTGTITVEPDTGYIRVGITSKAKDPSVALSDNSTAMAKLYATLKRLGVNQKEIRTVDFSVTEDMKTVKRKNEDGTEEYNYVSNGFIVSNQVNLTVCDLSNFGKILSAVVADGANRVTNISFGLKDREAKLDEARKAATADAKRKATTLAEGLSVTLGDVKSVSESVYTPRPRPYYENARSMAAADQAAPVSGGSMELTVNVSVTWKLRSNK